MPNDFFYYRSYGAVITDDKENGDDKGKDEDERVIKVSSLTVFSNKEKIAYAEHEITQT